MLERFWNTIDGGSEDCATCFPGFKNRQRKGFSSGCKNKQIRRFQIRTRVRLKALKVDSVGSARLGG
jgi:hypothetical protein